jgi:LuxR family transcriptional regulator, quorum-sensing system regulator SdiA
MQSREQLREQILGAPGMDGAVAVLAGELHAVGIDRFIAGFVRGVPRGFDGSWRLYKHRSYNFPQGWDDGWAAFNAHCPYYHSCFDGRIAFHWESVRRRNDLSALERQAWHYLADFGLVEGYTVPVHAPGHFGFVTVIGDRGAHAWAREMEAKSERLLYLAHVFHEAVRQRFPLFIENPDEESPLSLRERECLRWAAAGKTTEEVAAILDISQETVRVYFKRAMRKLGATTRTQAIARACSANLLS